MIVAIAVPPFAVVGLCRPRSRLSVHLANSQAAVAGRDHFFTIGAPSRAFDVSAANTRRGGWGIL